MNQTGVQHKQTKIVRYIRPTRFSSLYMLGHLNNLEICAVEKSAKYLRKKMLNTTKSVLQHKS